MFRTMLKSKIHRATITEADLNYIGSLTLDPDLMAAADLLPNELVHIVDINNGARFETYVIEGEPGTGMVKVNGAAARLVHSGDLVIIIGYGLVAEERAAQVKPRVVFVDERNRVLEKSDDPSLAAGVATFEEAMR
nr:aspartate decarboxylase [bacterium]